MNKSRLIIPLKKSYDDKSNYHVAFSISPTEKDSYEDILTKKALNSMLLQAKGIVINANHQYGLEDVIGVVTGVLIEKKDEMSYLWVDVRVQNKWVATLKDLVDSGVPLCGSIEYGVTSFDYTKYGGRLIDGIRLFGAALTTIPANRATLGTAASVEDGCPGSLCMQIQKQLMEDDIIVKKIRNNVISHVNEILNFSDLWRSEKFKFTM